MVSISRLLLFTIFATGFLIVPGRAASDRIAELANQHSNNVLVLAREIDNLLIIRENRGRSTRTTTGYRVTKADVETVTKLMRDTQLNGSVSEILDMSQISDAVTRERLIYDGARPYGWNRSEVKEAYRLIPQRRVPSLWQRAAGIASSELPGSSTSESLRAQIIAKRQMALSKARHSPQTDPAEASSLSRSFSTAPIISDMQGYRHKLPALKDISNGKVQRILPQNAGPPVHIAEDFSLHINGNLYHGDGSQAVCVMKLGSERNASLRDVNLVAILNVQPTFIITDEWIKNNIGQPATQAATQLCPEYEIRSVQVRFHLAGVDLNYSTGLPFYIHKQLDSYNYRPFMGEQQPTNDVTSYYYNDPELVTGGFIGAWFTPPKNGIAWSPEKDGVYTVYFSNMNIKSGSYSDYVKYKYERAKRSEEIMRQRAAEADFAKALIAGAITAFGTNESAFECSNTYDLGQSPPWYCNRD